MRFVAVGLDAQGRSTVVSTETIGAPDDPSKIAAQSLWSTPPRSEPPPPVPANGHFHDLGMADGEARWRAWWFPPGFTTDLHYTDTVDCQIVLEGEITLGLGAGEIVLRPGDAVLIPGLEHKWTAGPEGCRFTGFLRGFAPRTPA